MSKHHAPRAAMRRDQVRLLEKNPGMARRDYTDREDRAMRDEPEAMPADVIAGFASEGRNRLEVLRAREMREREHRTLQGHLRDLCTQAERDEVDVPELAVIRELIDAGRRRLRKAA